MGRWLVAFATGDTTTRTELSKRLNDGRPGMNDDEPAVVSCACHLALRSLQERRGGSATMELVDVLIRNFSESNPPSREDAGATATASLANPIATVPGLTQGKVFSVQGLLFYAASRALAMTQDETERLVREAEDLAIGLQFNPPLLQP